MTTTTAYREYCYRWTCPKCLALNQESDLKPGVISSCGICEHLVCISEIVYDNGAVMRASGIQKQSTTPDGGKGE